jgi:neutral ceramidase
MQRSSNHKHHAGRFWPVSFSSITLVLWTFYLVWPAQSVPGQESGLRAGVASIDITPMMPVTMAGYESRKELSKGVHDPLSSRAVVFEQNGQRLVLVSTDILGFYAGTADRFRQAIQEACQLKPGELFLTAIHTHSAPSPALNVMQGHTNNVEYTQWLGTRLTQVVQAAISNLAPIRIGYGFGSAPVGVNRRQIYFDESGNPKTGLGRNPTLMTDREVQVLKILKPDGQEPLAVLFAYSTHSTSLGPGNYQISGDVHGLAEQFVERYLGNGLVAPGFAGASGNIDPWFRVLPEFNTRNGWIPEPVLLGTMLGEEVVRVADGIQKASADGPIKSVFKAIKLPGKPRGDAKAATDTPPTTLNLTVGCVGDIGFVGLGGEVFNEIGRSIKTASPFPCTFVMTHCNGAAGYLPLQQSHLEGGYEVQSSPFAPPSADLVIKEAVHLLHELKGN